MNMLGSEMYLTETESTTIRIAEEASRPSMLSTINSRMLSVTPRPGGFLKLLHSRKSSTCATSAAESCPSKISTVDSKPLLSAKIQSTSRQSIREVLSQHKSNEYNLTINKENQNEIAAKNAEMLSHKLLPITISCVMLLASNVEKIDPEYFMYAERFLSCVKDEKGEYPPNIEGIINHMKCLQRHSILDPVSEAETEILILEKSSNAKLSLNTQQSKSCKVLKHICGESSPIIHITPETILSTMEPKLDELINNKPLETMQETSHSLAQKLLSTKELDSTILTKPLELPFIPTYKPIPYTFRVPSSTVFGNKNLAKCPPFHIQFDHTLAVIWNIFSKDEAHKELGVAQLQWALSFLKGIHDHTNQYPKDVLFCINTLEEVLIQKYAEMANAVKPPTSNTPKLGLKNAHLLASQMQNSNATIELKANEPKRTDSRIVIQKLPFSVTYADMTKGKQNNEIRFCVDPKKSTSLTGSYLKKEISQNLHKVTGTSTSSIAIAPNMSKNIMMEFLSAWRKEQIIKIQEELRRLKSIESFISNINQETTPILDTKQLDVLVEQNIKNYKFENNSVLENLQN